MSRPKGQDCGEVGISRHENSIFLASPRKNDFVTGVSEADVADVHRIVAGRRSVASRGGSALSVRNFKRNAEPGVRAPKPTRRHSGGTHECQRTRCPDIRSGSRAPTNQLPAFSVPWLLECVARGYKGRRRSGGAQPL